GSRPERRSADSPGAEADARAAAGGGVDGQVAAECSDPLRHRVEAEVEATVTSIDHRVRVVATAVILDEPFDRTVVVAEADMKRRRVRVFRGVGDRLLYGAVDERLDRLLVARNIDI